MGMCLLTERFVSAKVYHKPKVDTSNKPSIHDGFFDFLVYLFFS